MRSCLASFPFLAAMLWLCFASAVASASSYESAKALGRAAALRAAAILEVDWAESEAVVLTNAGYARPEGESTSGCLDGLAEATGASIGRSTLLSLQSRFDQPLWFACYNPGSGRCAYLQAEPARAAAFLSGQEGGTVVFSLEQTARIDAGHVLKHGERFKARADQGLFGQNLFRVVTAANAAAEGSPDDLLRSIAVHDHYCPGVTSGVLLARYVGEEFLASDPGSHCFVLSLDPWCKEDALTTLLNATPGKRGYAVVYPQEGRKADWPEPLDQTSTVIFTREGSGPWQGHMLRFDFAKAKAMFKGPKTGSPVLDKLAMDLWFLDFLDRPEVFVSEVGRLELPKGMSPKALMRPGADPVAMLAGM